MPNARAARQKTRGGANLNAPPEIKSRENRAQDVEDRGKVRAATIFVVVMMHYNDSIYNIFRKDGGRRTNFSTVHSIFRQNTFLTDPANHCAAGNVPLKNSRGLTGCGDTDIKEIPPPFLPPPLYLFPRQNWTFYGYF